jgi:hypothetical protein
MLQFKLLLGCFVICLAGCGGSTESLLDIFPVNGTVTVDGEAKQGVTVFFDPQQGTKGTGGGGVSDASGNFTVLYRDREGLPEGTYKVLFSHLVQPDGSPVPKDAMAADVGAVNSLPEKYSDSAKSPITATVTKENEPLKFELKTK